jgi:hypothetical protein
LKTEKPPTEPLREDPESQPHKGSGKQKAMPGVFENVKTYPKLEEKMGELSDAMERYAAAGKVCHEKRTEIKAVMLDRDITMYSSHGLIVDVDQGEPELHVTRIKEPKPSKSKDRTH